MKVGGRWDGSIGGAGGRQWWMGIINIYYTDI